MKIGIITLYYNSYNFGGLLQAYALAYFINKHTGHEAEQICYEVIREHKTESLTKLALNALKIIYHLPQRIKSHKRENLVASSLQLRAKTIDKWRNNIPHSAAVYRQDNIAESNQLYDCYITGSDQVWNLSWSDPSYFLNFADKEKNLLSYGASVGSDTLSEELKKLLIENLRYYNAISVRESSIAEEISILCNKPVSSVVDPTLLLSRDEWDSTCSSRLIQKRYVFCYFLGNDVHQREAAKAYAKKRDVLLVTIPYAPLDYMECDDHFGDERIFEADPSDFISLIKYAEAVFTDSFHAALFSSLYDKKFVVFERYGFPQMNGRVRILCKLFKNSYRFIEGCGEYDQAVIETVLDFNENSDFTAYLKERDNSISFLERSLNS